MVKEGFLEERLLSVQQREMGVYQMKNPGCKRKKRMAFQGKAHDMFANWKYNDVAEVQGKWDMMAVKTRLESVGGQKTQDHVPQANVFCRVIM